MEFSLESGSDFVDNCELVNWYQGLKPLIPVPMSPQLGDIWSRAAGWHRTWLRTAWYTGSLEDPTPWEPVPFSPSPASDALLTLRTWWLVTSVARSGSDSGCDENEFGMRRLTRLTWSTGSTGKASPSFLIVVEFSFCLPLPPSPPSSDCCLCQRSLKSNWV